MNKPPNQTNQSFSLSVCISIDHSTPFSHVASPVKNGLGDKHVTVSNSMKQQPACPKQSVLEAETKTCCKTKRNLSVHTFIYFPSKPAGSCTKRTLYAAW
jgi:hypothetical protein